MSGINLQTALVQIDGVILVTNLFVPEHARGLVVFSHGSSNSRNIPRNRFLADMLNEQGMATLVVDLLTEEEEDAYHSRFDIAMLAQRLVGVTAWAMHHPQLEQLEIGYFGDVTGTAAAICAAVDMKDKIRAIVSRGGRPDLAGHCLQRLRAPILLMVGTRDGLVGNLTQEAFGQISCPKNLKTIEGAMYLFQTPEQLHTVAALASDWFLGNMVKRENANR